MATEFEDVLTNQPVVVDNVRQFMLLSQSVIADA